MPKQTSSRGVLVVMRDVSPSISACELTCIDRQPISLDRMQQQHESYCRIFAHIHKRAVTGSFSVVQLPELKEFADSMFVEDVALMFAEGFAVLTNPGAASRKGEVSQIRDPLLASLRSFLGQGKSIDVDHDEELLRAIEEPGTMDGGDVLVVGRHVFVGVSTRTNLEGIRQLQTLLGDSYCVTPVAVAGCLHLKSAVSMLTPTAVVVHPEWVSPSIFEAVGIRCVSIDVHDEPHSANVVSFRWFCAPAVPNDTDNGSGVTPRVVRTVIIPEAFPKLQHILRTFAEAHNADENSDERMEIEVVAVDEIAKAEGALTCCSLILSSV